ncbi:hypothetical protein GCM10020221_03020 [Streptomyces thioluteus]|uniref:Carrier domain-containing protein n=1 Tax=Streptomyces thioluteus TaxID=66431 RepID=A0ABN3WBU8_STRTU
MAAPGRDTVEAVPGACPAPPGWIVNGQLTRARDGGPLPGSLAPARRIRMEDMEEMTVTQAGQDGGTAADADRMVREYLRTSRELVAAQRDVLLTVPRRRGGGSGGGAGAGRALPQAVVEPPAATVEPPAPRPSADVLATILDIIAERNRLSPRHDRTGSRLEADLSIDSIKRIEIVGESGRPARTSAAAVRSCPGSTTRSWRCCPRPVPRPASPMLS